MEGDEEEVEYVYKDNNKEMSFRDLLNWITEHKIFTVFLLILIIFGFNKVAKHFSRYIVKN